MKTIKGRFLLLITAVAMGICLSLGLVACGGKKPFSAPENVKVTGTTLSWDEVEGAENGYTVKINADETTKVSAAKLDLTTVTAKLKEGENTLAVKVNATDKAGESGYSDTKTYVYTPVTPPITLAVPTGLKAEGGIVSWNKVDKATSYVVSCGGHTETVTDTKVSTSLFNLTEGETVTFSVKAKRDEVESEAATCQYTVPNPVQEAKDAIAAVKEALPAGNEGIIAAVDGFDKIYAGYSEAVKSNAEVSAAYGELASIRGAAKAVIESEVDGLKTSVDELLGTEVKDFDQASYEQLAEKKDEINALGAYAKTYYTDYAAKIEALDVKAAEVKTTAINNEDGVEAFVNGANGTVTILYRATNVLGEAITGTAPALIVTLDEGTDNGVDTSDAAFTEHGGVFCYTVNFTKKPNVNISEENPAGEAPEYRLKVTYKIGDNARQEVKYIEFNDDIYFTAIPNEPKPDDYYAIKDGKIVFSGADNEAYFDIYETDVISIGADNNADPVITGFPLIKGAVVKNGISVEDFRRMLALNYAEILLNKTYAVRFVVYNKQVNGGIVISNIKNSLVSHDTYVLDLTEEDAKLPIDKGSVFDLGVWPVSGNFSLIVTGNVPAFIPQFNGVIDGVTIDENNVKNYVQIKITAYDKTDTAGAEPLFSKIVPFENQAYDYFSYMKDWAAYYFANGGTDNGNVNFYLTLTIQLKDEVNGQPNPFAKAFKDSASANVTVQNDYTGTYTFSKSDVTLPNDLLFKFTNAPILFPDGFKHADIVKNGCATLQLHVSNSADGENSTAFYVVYNDKNDTFVILKQADDDLSTGLVFGKGGSEYYNEFINDWFNAALGVNNFNVTGQGWYFCTELVDNPDDGAYLYSGQKSAWTTFYKPAEPVVPENKDLAVPTGNQIGLTEDGGGIMTFMLPGTDGNDGEGSRGWVLYHGANYIVIKFHVNAQDTEGHLAYLIPDMVHPEAALKMYANADKTGPALNCGTVTNGWVHIHDAGDGNAFEKWIAEAYADINENDFNIEEAKFCTSIYSDGAGNYVAGDGTNFSAAVTWEDRVKTTA